MTARPETVLDILTADYWNARNGDNKILFRTEGTGELWHYIEQTPFAAEFNWQALDPACLDEKSTKRRKRVSKLTIEINIKNRNELEESVSSDHGAGRILNERQLHDVAFASKTFSVHLERVISKKTSDGGHTLYTYRVLFDKSPYPPTDEWREPVFGRKCWEKHEFVSIKAKPGYSGIWMSIRYHLRFFYVGDQAGDVFGSAVPRKSRPLHHSPSVFRRRTVSADKAGLIWSSFPQV
ncbi:hypothetical protein N7509_013108 [Penicillium cosmopolitanum]|uniref:Uncharacterized protein n=1 Tax=Penicillium cosmopolitanum TaxID=1131564 RepID=A0A9W9SCN1_9EURO|nr:uncharacterized protein N7509_013108 [Penicillium cosmopolitanum]KAJ5376222.1 hypothetical protein N7509_013108 [Penicillium cosmopolitanum]